MRCLEVIMEEKRIEIFLFIDALGWKIVNDHNFLATLLPYRKKIEMQFGYSSSAIPTILSGTTPAKHGHLGLFAFAPEKSPFKLLSNLSFLFKPDNFWNRGRVRHHLSKLLKKFYNFTGYFQLYRMPLWKLKYMDYCEKKNLFISKGMDDIPNLHDVLTNKKINFHISDWHLSDHENYLASQKAIEEGKNFLFVYTASFDGLLHDKVGNFDAVEAKLQEIAKEVANLYHKAKEYASNVNFTIISDHGMTPLTSTVNIASKLAQTNLVFGKDYGSCLDSTMARFYYLTEKSKDIIHDILKDFPGRILTKEEEIKYGIFREDRAFGDEIFLLDAGIQIAPSDMGEKPLNGMHGFDVNDEHSFAVMLSNTDIPQNINKVADYFNLMIERAENL